MRRVFPSLVLFWAATSAVAALPDAVAQAIAHGNAERLWHLQE